MKSSDIVKIFMTVILAPTAAFVAVFGSTHHDGSQVTLGIAIITFLGLLWGPPDKHGGGGTHAR